MPLREMSQSKRFQIQASASRRSICLFCSIDFTAQMKPEREIAGEPDWVLPLPKNSYRLTAEQSMSIAPLAKGPPFGSSFPADDREDVYGKMENRIP
ncbi:hypothetical protein A5N86_12550 [Geobacillus thermoleovorans]|uniref:Uncharacterized protein n=2 Tax=Geobacillus TaxID=129337 RepID=Q5L3J1_GEOKA|nr:hypothetical protein BGM21_00710 [Geobacillus thermoleovorans]EQB95925.1 hypothetical protein GA8_09020 [Geobacillus sp. A8]ESU73629.1 hypothetical protein T260_01910 [Geobacillus sp. MAS1]KDE50487.1 hypothetical protein DI44_14895 [Geobacillus sp. CAMR5420]BAD74489.1 hypothetical protein GK0204 [Geobacillus kaustophilus HTA426]